MSTTAEVHAFLANMETKHAEVREKHQRWVQEEATSEADLRAMEASAYLDCAKVVEFRHGWANFAMKRSEECILIDKIFLSLIEGSLAWPGMEVQPLVDGWDEQRNMILNWLEESSRAHQYGFEQGKRVCTPSALEAESDNNHDEL
ncbi:hypothetical protein LTS10_007925 [Elasticomyces elasticus]|nr:hypothetical protein LTS10_007925 [Elasticomyces elasticus]